MESFELWRSGLARYGALVMRGTITGKDVVLNSVTIVRLFGVGAYLSCLWAALSRRPTTFLGALYPASVHTSPRWRATR